jgi:hypothetical protein
VVPEGTREGLILTVRLEGGRCGFSQNFSSNEVLKRVTL